MHVLTRTRQGIALRYSGCVGTARSGALNMKPWMRQQRMRTSYQPELATAEYSRLLMTRRVARRTKQETQHQVPLRLVHSVWHSARCLESCSREIRNRRQRQQQMT